MKIVHKHSWYSVIMALLIIWFLLVLTTGIFRLVLSEMKDNRAMWDYIKAYAWAESATELALLQIKKYGYAYYDKIDHTVNERSIVLAKNPLDTSDFHKPNDVFISYDIWSKVNRFESELEPLEYAIIPLFYVTDSWEQKVNAISFTIDQWTPWDLSWNVIWKQSGISGKGTNTTWVKKSLDNLNEFVYSTQDINSFLAASNTNYLVFFHTGNSGTIKYTLSSNNSNQYFSKPKTQILSSWEVGKYKQNLLTDLDNTEFLNILKYSIFSN